MEAKNGYKGKLPHYIKIPNPLDSEEKSCMQSIVQMRHETVNQRFKQFGALKQVFQRDLLFQSIVMRAFAVVTQLAFENG